MIGVNSVQGTGKVRMRASGSVKYGREESVRRQPQHRSKSLKVSNSAEFNTGLPKKEKVMSLTFGVVFVCLEWRWFLWHCDAVLTESLLLLDSGIFENNRWHAAVDLHAHKSSSDNAVIKYSSGVVVQCDVIVPAALGSTKCCISHWMRHVRVLTLDLCLYQKPTGISYRWLMTAFSPFAAVIEWHACCC